MKLCECGCGTPTPRAAHTRLARGVVKGEPVRYCVGHVWRGKKRPDHAAKMRGKSNPNYRDGRYCA